MTTTGPARDWLDTTFCRLTGVRYPIVQTGMGWVSGASLTAATANAGGLGVLAAVTLEEDAMVAAVRKVRARTDAPFGVNLRPDQPDLERRLERLIELRVPVVSFAGAPTPDTVRKVHDAGQLCIVTVGRPRHAEKMAQAGVDVLIAQGAEGGGHTGDVPTSLLLPAVIDVVRATDGDIPVLAAGGFRDGRGLAAAIAWGADGIAMGTRFLMTRESQVPAAVKARYVESKPGDAVVSTVFDGRRMRVLKNRRLASLSDTSAWRRLLAAPANAAAVKRATGSTWSEVVREGLAMRRRENMTLAQIATAADAPMMIKAAMVDGDPDDGVLPAGEVAGLLDDEPTVAELIERIMAEARLAATRLAPAEV